MVEMIFHACGRKRKYEVFHQHFEFRIERECLVLKGTAGQLSVI